MCMRIMPGARSPPCSTPAFAAPRLEQLFIEGYGSFYTSPEISGHAPIRDWFQRVQGCQLGAGEKFVHAAVLASRIPVFSPLNFQECGVQEVSTKASHRRTCSCFSAVAFLFVR